MDELCRVNGVRGESLRRLRMAKAKATPKTSNVVAICWRTYCGGCLYPLVSINARLKGVGGVNVWASAS